MGMFARKAVSVHPAAWNIGSCRAGCIIMSAAMFNIFLNRLTLECDPTSVPAKSFHQQFLHYLLCCSWNLARFYNSDQISSDKNDFSLLPLDVITDNSRGFIKLRPIIVLFGRVFWKIYGSRIYCGTIFVLIVRSSLFDSEIFIFTSCVSTGSGGSSSPFLMSIPGARTWPLASIQRRDVAHRLIWPSWNGCW